MSSNYDYEMTPVAFHARLKEVLDAFKHATEVAREFHGDEVLQAGADLWGDLLCETDLATTISYERGIAGVGRIRIDEHTTVLSHAAGRVYTVRVENNRTSATVHMQQTWTVDQQAVTLHCKFSIQNGSFFHGRICRETKKGWEARVDRMQQFLSETRRSKYSDSHAGSSYSTAASSSESEEEGEDAAQDRCYFSANTSKIIRYSFFRRQTSRRAAETPGVYVPGIHRAVKAHSTAVNKSAKEISVKDLNDFDPILWDHIV